MCVIGRKIFPTKSQRVCLGEVQNTPVVCSEWRSLPTVASIQKALLFLVDFIAMFASIAKECLLTDAAFCTAACGVVTEKFALTVGKEKVNEQDTFPPLFT